MKIYKTSTLYNSSNKIIEGTDFISGVREQKFISSKNTTVSLTGAAPAMTLSYKVGFAIANSQNENYNIYRIRYDNNRTEFYLGCFDDGTKSKNEYFYCDFKNQEFMATNMYSHRLFLLMIAYARYQNPSEEIDTNFSSIDFDTPEKVIGSNQKEQFFRTADSLYFLAKETFLEKSWENDCEKDDFKDFIYSLKRTDIDISDITAFVKNKYDNNRTGSKLCKSAKEIGIPDNVKIIKPCRRKKAPTMQQKKNDLQATYFDGIHMMEDDEIEKLPLLLKNGYKEAQDAFMANRDFFGYQEWQLVDGIAKGDTRSVNFTGPAGVGKTTICRAIAGCLGLPFILVGGSENIEESDLLGMRNIEAVDGVSVTTWTDGPITLAIRYGAVLLFDEVNAAEPGILMKLNTILDGSKCLMLSTSEKVGVHPNFVYCEAMNVGAAYVGTGQMNQSHFDRIDEIYKIAQKSVQEEAAIVASNTGYDNIQVLEKLCTIKKYIITLINEEGDSAEMICSLRRIICWVKKAKRTGEWIESSLSTVIAHLGVYDESFDVLTKEAVLESSGIASTVLEKIIEQLNNVSY